MSRDPHHIAQAIRSFRGFLGWTQENLAEFSNLTTRTIQKAESGRHCPDENTLQLIAKAFRADLSMFTAPAPGELERMAAEAEVLRQKSVLVRTTPVHTPTDVIKAVGNGWHMLRSDISAVSDEDALLIAAQVIDFFTDLMDLWADISMAEHVHSAQELAKLFLTLGQQGYVCYVGNHQQMQRINGKSNLVFRVGLVAIGPRTDKNYRYSLVILDDPWEPLPQDRQAPSIMVPA